MNNENIIKKLKEIIIKTMNLEFYPDDNEGENLIGKLGINSVDALEILVWVENEFDISFPDEDLSADLLSSLDYLAEYIHNRKKNSIL